MTIAIIGAGASGMAAAITAAASGRNQVLLFERQARVGKKLSATGNGRCNLTNRQTNPGRYHGNNPDFVRFALELFPPNKVLDFFQTLGLYTVTEADGKVYPYSDQANSVVDVLRFGLNRRNLQLLTGTEIVSVKKTSGGFRLKDSCGQFWESEALIVACGGAAGTKLGGGLSGYQLLRSLGHHCTKLSPSLVQLKTDPALVRGLKGVRANAGLRLTINGTLAATAWGEVQFTDYGVSGPAVFEISRTAATADGTVLHLDLLPGQSADELLSALCIRISRFPTLEAGDLLTGILHNRLGRMLVGACGIPISAPLTVLSWEQLNAVVEKCHGFVLPITGNMGMDGAQVTAGGIVTREFNPETLQSRIVPGLYACGEVLDIDGDCGGFNLQWAWASGLLAGQVLKENES
ncbi:MAG: aminoacetone oxidase family FAD-binding enzyme [Oscillospiraceae bacterium]|nr:aminoacetone oxidase family FAD-binding enzyme [Oscillospiraceae bacterium]